MSGMTTFSPLDSSNFLSHSLNLISELLTDILINLDTLGDCSLENKTFFNNELLKLTGEISRFVEITTLLGKYLLSSRKHNTSEIKNSHIALLGIMNAMAMARKNSDFLALGDLIKHDLKDNLSQWKNVIIPQTKKLLSK